LVLALRAIFQTAFYPKVLNHTRSELLRLVRGLCISANVGLSKAKFAIRELGMVSSGLVSGIKIVSRISLVEVCWL